MDFKYILNELKDWLALLAPISLVLGLIWKYFIKKKITDLKDLFDKITSIASEFRPNGGSTLRDAINRIERKVTINEQKTLAIIKSLPLGTFTANEFGKIIDVNTAFCKMIGRTESQIKGDNWQSWLQPAEKDLVVDEWNRSVAGLMNFDMSYSFVLPNGNLQLVHIIAYQLRDEADKLIGFLGTVQNS